ncbi:unnamed protein product [Sphagnum tenellum]
MVGLSVGERESKIPDRFGFVPLLNACASLGALEEGRQAHEQIIQSGCEADVFVGCSLVDMYAKCGSIEDAQRVFNKMPSRDAATWTAMILGHVKCGQGQKALELFRQMQQEGVQPSSFTFVGVVNACVSLVTLEEGRTCDMYEGQKALELFRQRQLEVVRPDSFTFVAVLNACTSVLAIEECRSAHEQVIQSGWDSYVKVGNCLVDMYAKCGSMEDTWRVFNNMASHDVVSWNAILGGCAMHGHGKEALKQFEWMCEEGVQPDDITFVCLPSACSHAGLVDEGMRCYASMSTVYMILAKLEHSTCMIDLSWPHQPSTGGREYDQGNAP